MKADTYTAAGVPVVRGANITNSRTPTGEFVFVSEETAASMPGCILCPGDVVFPHRGAIGEVGLIEGPPNTRMMLSTSLMKFTPDSRQLAPMFVYYFFRSRDGRSELLKRASTVGTPGIGQPLESLRSIEMPLPPIEEQRGIAATLGALDDKIESNRRVAAVCDELADALAARALSEHPTRFAELSELVEFNREVCRPGVPGDRVRYIDIASVSPGEVGEATRITWADARAGRAAECGIGT